MKYKVGDKVRIKSLDWYNKNKDNLSFYTDTMALCFANEIVTIKSYGRYPGTYRIVEDEGDFLWTDEMFKGLAEEEIKPEPKFKVGDKVILDPYPCKVTDVHWRDSLHGFVYTVRGTDFGKTVKEDDLVFDERLTPTTDEIIRLIKNDWNNFKDRYNIPDDYHFVDKNGNEINISDIVLEKKKKEYPKTYEECCKVLGINPDNYLSIRNLYRDDGDEDTTNYEQDLLGIFDSLWELKICRDAYWKIAGEEMGLGKPWEPDWKKQDKKYIISVFEDTVIYFENEASNHNTILAFPTEEMRDAFYEAFKKKIEECKELL